MTVSIANLLHAIDERTIAQRVSILHDEARMSYTLDSNRVADFDTFNNVIADYYNYHFTKCISGGGSLSASEAAGRAKEILVRHYRQRGGDIMTAFNDAYEGTNGGLRVILDIIADSLKSDAIEHYIRDIFDSYVSPASWDQKREIIKQFIAHVGPANLSGMHADQCDRYAAAFETVIRAYTNGMQRALSVLRRF